MIFPSRNSRKGLHLPSNRNGSKGHGQSSDPLHFQRRPVDVSYLLLYLIHLPGHGPVPLPPGPQPGLASCRGASGGWGIPPRLHRGQGTLLARLPFRPFRGPASLRAISRLPAASPIFASTNGGSPPPVAVPSTGLSFSSVRAGAFVSIFLGLGRFLPGRFPR